MKSKTIILSSQKKFSTNSPRAIVTFISDNKQLEGKLRLYNMQDLPAASKLGIYYNETVYSANLVKKDGAYSFFLDENFNLDNNIYCAIIDRANHNDVVLCGGTANSFVFSFDEDNEEDETGEEQTPIIENENLNTSQCENCKTCDNCVYKEYFYAHHKKENDEIKDELNQNESENIADISQQSIENAKCEPNKKDNDFEDNNISLETTEQQYPFEEVEINSVNKELKNEKIVYAETSESEKFLKQITDQLDDMFKTYPEDNTIMHIIPNSKVIKVTDSIDESSYIVGVIYENGEINYLLYGVPAKYNDNPPKELGENYQWLPLNVDDPMSDGYFLIYQDATSGKIVPIRIE